MRAGRRRKDVKTHEEIIYKIKEGVIKKNKLTEKNKKKQMGGRHRKR